jgi:hypothetical protein
MGLYLAKVFRKHKVGRSGAESPGAGRWQHHACSAADSLPPGGLPHVPRIIPRRYGTAGSADAMRENDKLCRVAHVELSARLRVFSALRRGSAPTAAAHARMWHRARGGFALGSPGLASGKTRSRAGVQGVSNGKGRDSERRRESSADARPCNRSNLDLAVSGDPAPKSCSIAVDRAKIFFEFFDFWPVGNFRECNWKISIHR